MKNFATLVLCLCASVESFADDLVSPQTPKAANAIEQHQSEAGRLEEAYKQRIESLDQAYAERIKQMRNTLKEELAAIRREIAVDDLDEAVRIRDFSRAMDALPIAGLDEEAEALGAQINHSTSGKEVVRLQTELQKLKDRLSSSISLPEAYQNLVRVVGGRSYRIDYLNGNFKLWTLHPDGTLEVDGERKRTWGPCSPNSVACFSSEGTHVDILSFGNDGRTCAVMYIGDAKQARHRYPGILQSQ